MTKKMKMLADEYREGIAEALGVPPEDINPEIVDKWVEDWAKAFLKPAVFYKLFDEGKVKENTKNLIRHVVSLNTTTETPRRRGI